jgi:hypothetical protein
MVHLCAGGLLVKLDQQNPHGDAGGERQAPKAEQAAFQGVQEVGLCLMMPGKSVSAALRSAIRLP